MLEGGINGIVMIMILRWRHVHVCVCVCVLGGRGCVGAPAHLIGSFQRSLTVLHHCTEHDVWILQHQSLHRLLVHLQQNKHTHICFSFDFFSLNTLTFPKKHHKCTTHHLHWRKDSYINTRRLWEISCRVYSDGWWNTDAAHCWVR